MDQLIQEAADQVTLKNKHMDQLIKEAAAQEIHNVKDHLKKSQSKFSPDFIESATYRYTPIGVRVMNPFRAGNPPVVILAQAISSPWKTAAPGGRVLELDDVDQDTEKKLNEACFRYREYHKVRFKLPYDFLEGLFIMVYYALQKRFIKKEEAKMVLLLTERYPRLDETKNSVEKKEKEEKHAEQS